jgi:hypothetical protein
LFSGPPGGARAAPRRARRKGRAPKRFRPLLLSKLIGPRPLKPPPAGLAPPAALAGLDAKRPRLDEGGKPLTLAAAPASAVESLDPAGLPRDRRVKPHWDGTLWHAGAARGVVRAKGWAWLYRDGSRWWAEAGGEALLRHDGVWWTKRRGVWFVLHDGEPWAWRPFHDWDSQGLFQPGSGAEMVYSRDFKRVAVIAPGAGAEVYDARDGRLLDRIPEAEMPARRRPHPLRSFRLPGVFAR